MAKTPPPTPNPYGPTAALPYADYGYLPGVAQAAQSALYPNPHLNPQPWFTIQDLEAANWFTTRVHLSPLGKVTQ